MIPQARTFRVFVSSTFSDLKAERDALQARVFPRLRAFCAARSARFQAIDLRWGVSQEAARDQQTMNICLGEIERCQQVTPRPNFIVLLGNRYGWRPPPPQIPAVEFAAMYQTSSPQERRLLDTWYRRDDNAVPPEYLLQPWDDFSYARWSAIEAAIHAALERRASEAGLDVAARFKYSASATHQEIAAGALQVEDAAEHVFCFAREIKDLPQDETAAEYLDLDRDGEVDQDAIDQLVGLKRELQARLGKNYKQYFTSWTQTGPARDHLDRLCKDAYRSLVQVIERELAGQEETDPLEVEIAAHAAFGEERARFFTGRAETLAQIEVYLQNEVEHPLAIWGESGSGKSALLAEAVKRAQRQHPGAEITYRFIGATPDSSTVRALLEGLCRQIARAYGADERDIPSEYKDLVKEFPGRLALAKPDKPLIIFIDALDQLQKPDIARNLAWLSPSLPDYVHIIVSTLPGEFKENLEIRHSSTSLIELEAMAELEASSLLDLWLSSARRTLQPDQKFEILSKFAECPKPLYLKLAFEEARHWNSSSSLPPGREAFPGLAHDIPGIIRGLFTRLSAESNHGEPLLSRSLGYLAAAKNGLTEDELLDLLARDIEVYSWFLQSQFHTPPDLKRMASQYLEQDRGMIVGEQEVVSWLNRIRQDNQKSELRDFLSHSLNSGANPRLPVVLWTRLYNDLEPYLTMTTADGTSLLSFYHPTSFGRAVSETYFDVSVRDQFHTALAAYFKNQPLELDLNIGVAPNLRKLSELPYQLSYGHLWEDLQATLTDFSFLYTTLCAKDPLAPIEGIKTAYEAGYQDDDLSLVQGALQLSLHVLAKDPSLLAGQLIGRMDSHNFASIENLLHQAENWRGSPWLRPMTPSLQKAGGTLLRTLEGHTDSVVNVTITPDCSHIISGAKDGTIRVWDLEKGIEVNQFQLPRSHAFNAPPTIPVAPTVLPDGIRLLAGVNQDIYIWNLETGECETVIPGNGKIDKLEVSQDGKKAISEASASGTIFVWDLEKQEIIHKLAGHTGLIFSIGITPDNRYALSTCADQTFRIWDLETGIELHTLKTQEGTVLGFALIDHGKFAITRSENSRVKIWDIQKGTEVGLIANVKASGITTDPGGNFLILQLWNRGDDCIEVWDLSTREKLFRLIGLKGVWCLPHGREAISIANKNTLKVWDIKTGEIKTEFAGHGSTIDCVAVSPNGKWGVSGSRDKSLKVWDLATPAMPDNSIIHSKAVSAIVVLPGEKQVASGSGDNTIKIWDIQTGACLATLEPDYHGVKPLTVFLPGVASVAVFPDGRHILSTHNSKIILWDLVSRREIAEYTEHKAQSKVVALPDGKRFVSFSGDKTIKVWSIDSPASLATLEGHESPVYAGVVTPDGGKIFTGSQNNVRVWDLLELKELESKTFNLFGLAGAFQCIAVHPDGNQVYIGSRTGFIHILDLPTMRMVGGFRGHQDWVFSINISPDGRLAISGSRDNTLIVWDIQSRKAVATFPAESTVGSIAVLPDNRTILCGTSAGQIHYLHLEGVE